MTSSNCYSSLHPFPIDLNQDIDQHQQHQLFSLDSQAPPSSSLNCPNFFNSTVSEPAGYYQREPQQFQDQEDQEKIYVPQDGPLESDSELKLSIWKKEERTNESHQGHAENSSAKWMSSKMRMMRKMMTSDPTDLSNNFTPKFEDRKKQQLASSPDNSSNSSYNNNNSSSTVRVCADCNTTKTPLWRSGPRGPMSLCNACGIRQRKARRAMAEAAAAADGSIVAAENKPSMKNKAQHKAKRSGNGCAPRFKNKKYKHGPEAQARKKLCFEDLRIILSKNSAFHQVFPQDEKEAAILLMALSYGLVH
ncbi:hypothetical protein PTKIN_Ptkin19aG0076700 [Pterospermum kingtungense]